MLIELDIIKIELFISLFEQDRSPYNVLRQDQFFLKHIYIILLSFLNSLVYGYFRG